MKTTCFASVQDAFEAIAAAHPNNTAASCSDQFISYRQLSRQSDALASLLVDQGVESGDLVGLCCERRIEMVIAILAILKAGAAYVPFDSAYPKARLLGMATDAGVQVMIGDMAVFDELDLKRIPFDSFPESATSDSATKLPESERTSLAYVMFTSGSTGRPKGVAVAHQGILRLVIEPNYCSLGPDEKILQHSPVAFDASTFEIWGALLNGGEVVILPPGELSLRSLGEVIKDSEITSLWLTAGLFHAMVEERPEDFAAVRQLLTGGDVVSPKHANTILKQHANLNLINGYGPTENTTFTCCHSITLDDVSGGAAIPIGSAISGTEIFVVDAKLNQVADGERGELVCAGDGVALGYWQNESLSSKVFVSAPWDSNVRLYRTGDSVIRRPDGVVDFFGRIDQQVKIRGFRIELGEIETRILEIDAVQQTHVVAEAVSEGADKVLIAHYVGDRDIPKSEFQQSLDEKLAQHSIPSFYNRLDEIPLTPNGKVDRKQLPSLASLLSTGESNGSSTGFDDTETVQQIVTAVGEVLELKSVPRHTNFFDLGASSIQIARIHERVQARIGTTFPVTDFFQFPNADLLAKHLGGQQETSHRAVPAARSASNLAEPIAVIGYAGRFPGAESVEALWDLICQGKDGLRDLSDQELAENGVPLWKIRNERYVKRGVELHDYDKFDADLFGISHHEAEITDPQARVFLETCHDALLHSGYPPAKQDGRIGLFGSSGVRSYSWRRISYSDLSIERLTDLVGNEKDFLTTRVSYRLGLTGVSMPVQTACSSSLVAIHMARQSLLCGDSDIAIAGGVSINCPQGTGYMAAEGTMFSLNGRCRVFDQDADGTLFTPGAGAVILKRLSDAQADGDMIHAVLIGTGVNNDGNRKVGFAAPSVQGQAGAIADALGDFDAKDVRYVEAHGTATKLGDPIELTGLQSVYDADKDSPECLVGSIKANLGHTDAAAGITGFIKAMLVAKHGVVPPTINHDKPTESFDFPSSRFRVNTELEPLPRDGAEKPLIGVSSFGIGGTNAHAVLAPPPETETESDETSLLSPIVLPVSAASKKSLRRQIENLERLVEQDKPRQQDLAYSLSHGRPDLNWRAPALLIPDKDKGTFKLRFPAEESWTKKKDHQATAFLFTGQGAQYPSMAKGLYQNEPEFQETMDQVCAVADPILGQSLSEAIFEGSAETLGETWLTQVALFAVEVANARLWQSRGVVPSALVGHSIGEYAAAVIGGVFTLEDATRAVIERGRLMWSMPAGKMAVFPLAADEVAEMIKDEPALELATLNCPELNVIAGPEDVLSRFIEKQEANGVSGRLLHTSHAFHTQMMDEALAPFEAFLDSLGPRSAPKIPIYSNVTGQRMTAEQATSAAYWAKHIRQPVRFEQCIRQALDDSITHFVEVGPGRTLSTFVRKSLTSTDNAVPVETIRHPKDDACDHETFLNAVGKYWAVGGQIDWSKNIASGGKLIELPRYPYDRKRFWREPDTDSTDDSNIKNPDLSQWFYRPIWESATIAPSTSENVGGDLLVISGGRLPPNFQTKATRDFDSTFHVALGKEFTALENGYAVARPAFLRDFNKILAKLERPPSRIIVVPTMGHSWSSASFSGTGLSHIHANRNLATEAILHLIQACHTQWPGQELDLTFVSSGSCEVVGGDLKNPQDATIRGFARVVALEFPHHTTRWIDIDKSLEAFPWTLGQANAEFAIRNGKLWKANWVQKVLDAPASDPFRDGQTFLITGGTNGVGLAMARLLGTQHKVNLVLAARSELPEPDSEEGKTGRFAKVFSAISEIEAAGSKVLVVKADVTKPETVSAMKRAACASFGSVDGVFHAAGVLFDRPMLLKERVTLDQVLRPKIEGSWVLADVFSNSDFLFLFSSISSAIPPAGQCDYSAGNNFMDALANQFAAKRKGLKVISANWGSWREVGMAARLRDKPGAEFLQQEYENGIEPEEGFDCIKRIIASGEPQLAVYSRDFVKAYHSHAVSQPASDSFAELTPEDSGGDLEPPATDLETQLLNMFAQSLKRRDIGVLDCFFDLGGDSLMAVGLLTRIRKETGIALPNSILFQAPHVRALAAEIGKQDGSATIKSESETSNAQASLANYVIPIETEGSGVPVFGIHGAGGSVLFYRKTTQALVGLHPFYAIEDPLVKNSPETYLAESINEKAELYLTEILKIYVDGPLVLIGYSFGAKIAAEIARIFKRQFADRTVIILNIDQPATMNAARRYGFKEKMVVAWNRPAYVNRPRRAIFVASRLLGGLTWHAVHGPRLKRAYEMLKKTGQMHENETVRFRQIEFHNNTLDVSPDVEPVDAHMVILKAADGGDKHEFIDDYGWADLVTSLKIIQVPGDHLSVVSEENQPFMAAQIGASIQRLLAEHGTP